MISFLIATVLILLLIAIKLLKGTIYATQKVGEITFAGAGRVAGGVRKPSTGKLRKAGSTVMTAGKAGVKFAGTAARKFVGIFEMVLKVSVGFLIPIGVVEIITSLGIFLVVVGSAAGYYNNIREGIKKTQETSQVQAAEASKDLPTVAGTSARAGVFRGTGNPGIKDEEWNKISKYAKMTINTAIAFVQDDTVFYSQPIVPGGYDCSAFQSTVVELGTGYTFSGKKVTKYDDKKAKEIFDNRATLNKTALQEQHYTVSMQQAYPPGSDGYVGTTKDPDWQSKILPGDMLNYGGAGSAGHIRMYLGHRKSDGKVLFIESGGYYGQHYKDVDMKVKAAHTLGINDGGVELFAGAVNGMQIERPYVRMK